MQRARLVPLLLLPLLLATGPAALGMGTTGGRDVIHPEADFKALLLDKDGIKVEVHRLNIGGDVQLDGDLGRGNLRIAFDTIQSVDFSPDSQDYTHAVVHLKSGESVTLRVRSSLMIYGQTPVGIYEIRARDLQRITFQS